VLELKQVPVGTDGGQWGTQSAFAGHACAGPHVWLVHCRIDRSKQVPVNGGATQRAAQNSFGVVHGDVGLHAWSVHESIIVSKQFPVTLPWQPSRHVPSVARHPAAPLFTCAAHCSKQLPRLPTAAAMQPRTQVWAAVPTVAKHVRAALPQPAGQVPDVDVGGQLP
jgi:hypothetical protein